MAVEEKPYFRIVWPLPALSGRDGADAESGPDVDDRPGGEVEGGSDVGDRLAGDAGSGPDAD
ncbi:hypothetical protein ACFQX6_25615 [Streptosporangium lutulentum]